MPTGLIRRGSSPAHQLCDAVDPVALVQALADRGVTIASDIDYAPVEAGALLSVD